MPDLPREILAAAGIDFGDPDYGLQYNLCHAALDREFGVRAGSDLRVERVLAARGLGWSNPEKAAAKLCKILSVAFVNVRKEVV
jgi:hypothetical protein